MRQRVLQRHMPPRLADHRGELALVVELVGDPGLDDRLVMADQRLRVADEQRRMLRRLAPALLGVLGVVQPAAQIFRRVPDRRMVAQPLGGADGPRRRVQHHGGDALHDPFAEGQQPRDVARQLRRCQRQVDDLVAAPHADRRNAVLVEGQEPHR